MRTAGQGHPLRSAPHSSDSEDARLLGHDNESENTSRREVVGRKSWLFVGNDGAGEVDATFCRC